MCRTGLSWCPKDGMHVCAEMKVDHKFDEYLVKIPKIFSVLTLKLRSCNHILPIERGKYSNIPRERRYCELCDENRPFVGDKYHFSLQCKNTQLVQYRNQFIPQYYRDRLNMVKFIELIACISNNRKLAIRVGSYLRKAFSLIR